MKFLPIALLTALALAITSVTAFSGSTVAYAKQPAATHAARSPRVTLHARALSAHEVRLQGHAPGAHARVVLQVRRHMHWVPVARVRAHHHHFVRTVRQNTSTARYRALSGRHRSAGVRLHLASTPASPVKQGKEPTTTADPPPAPGSSTPAPTVQAVTAGAMAQATSQLLSTATSAATSPIKGEEPAPDACGIRPEKADGTYWSCTFDDEFDGTTLNRSKWVPQTSFATGDATAFACYLDDPDNISVSDGSLHLTVRKQAAPVSCGVYGPTTYTSGMVSTYHLFSQTYGRFQVRMRTTATVVPGLQETFWLWPDDRYSVPSVQWPAAGEVDVAEFYSQYPNLDVPFLHYTANDNGGPVPGVNTQYCTALRGVYNTYTLEWTPSTLRIMVNGATCLLNTSADPAFTKPYIVALTQALGVTTNALTAATPLPATSDVDYVHVWK